MANSVIGALRVMLGMDSSEFEKGATRTQRSMQSMQRKFEQVGSRMQSIGVGMTAAITAPLAAMGVQAFKSATEMREASAQVEAALASMGGASGRTAEQLRDAADELETFSNFDDSEILGKLTANMLTFGNVSGEVFDRAQQAALDLATRMDKDLQSSAIMVGKALNDPIRGLSALGEAGIQFTESQRETVKAMVDAGDVAGAQTLILRELEKQYGGAAKAARDAAPGGDVAQAWRDLNDAVGERLVAAFARIEQVLTPIVKAFLDLSPPVQTAAIAITGIAAAAGPLLFALGGLVKMLPLIGGGIKALGIATGPVGITIAAIAAAGVLIYENWDTIGPMLERLGAKFTEVLGPRLQNLIETVKTTLTELWEGPLGEGLRGAGEVLAAFGEVAAEVLGEVLPRILAGAVEVVTMTFDQIGHALQFVSSVLTGDFAGAWQAAKDFLQGAVTGMLRIVEAVFPELAQLGRDIINGIVAGIKAAPGAVYDALMRVIGNGVERVKEFLGINSPSLLFMGFGRNITEGLAIGIEDRLPMVVQAMQEMGDVTETQGARVVRSFEDMAEGALGQLDRLLKGIKGGGITDILGGLFGLGSAFGLFGKSGGAGGQLPTGGLLGGGAGDWSKIVLPGFANGGAMKLGGMPGVDSNLLSLNGSPLARVSRGETMTIAPANDRGGAQVVNNYYTLPSDEFWQRVDGRADQRVMAAGPGIAQAGAGMALSRLRQSNERRLA